VTVLVISVIATSAYAQATNTELQKSFPTPVGKPNLKSAVIRVKPGDSFDGKGELFDRERKISLNQRNKAHD